MSRRTRNQPPWECGDGRGGLSGPASNPSECLEQSRSVGQDIVNGRVRRDGRCRAFRVRRLPTRMRRMIHGNLGLGCRANRWNSRVVHGCDTSRHHPGLPGIVPEIDVAVHSDCHKVLRSEDGGDGIRTHDLNVMSVASYRCSTPRRWPVVLQFAGLTCGGQAPALAIRL